MFLHGSMPHPQVKQERLLSSANDSQELLMNRREFSCIMTSAAVSAMLPSCLLAQQPPGKISGVSEPAAELYRRALVLDSGMLLKLERSRYSDTDSLSN